MSRLTLALCLILIFGLGSAHAEVNLLANPGFEDGGGSYAGWFTFGAGVQLSTPATDNIIRTGDAASKVYGEFTNCPSPTFDVGGYGQLFTPTSGRVYTFSGWTYISSSDPMLGTDTCNSNRVLAKIAFFDAVTGGAEIAGNEIVIGDGNMPVDQWMPFSVSIPAPSTALRVEALILFLQPGCDTGSVFVDDLSFTETTPDAVPNLFANASFDGGLASWNPFGNVFSETRSFLVRTPQGSAKLFSTFTLDSPSGIFQSFPATPGKVYEMTAHTLSTCREDPINLANDNYLLGRLVFKDGQGAEVGAADQVILDSSSPLGTWAFHSLNATAPAGAATVEAYVLFISPTLQSGAAFIDDLGLREMDATDAPPTGGRAVALRQNVPNPFNPRTRIDFELATAGRVELAVYDVAGRRVATLQDGPLAAGPHSVVWSGRTDEGVAAATGVYRYVLVTPQGTTARSMVLLK